MWYDREQNRFIDHGDPCVDALWVERLLRPVHGGYPGVVPRSEREYEDVVPSDPSGTLLADFFATVPGAREVDIPWPGNN